MNTPFEVEIITTTDGSHTLKLVGHDEQYHSINGAFGESQHVFLHAGYNALNPDSAPIHILEVGLGTGLNALVTAHKSLSNKTEVYYHAIEPFPLNNILLEQLNYSGFFKEKWLSGVFKEIHSAGEFYKNIREYFHFKLSENKIQQISLKENYYQLVYFDAFGPDTQADMWTQDVFVQLFKAMSAESILVTYCAKGAVKRALRAAGFRVENLPGPPGKREITRAIKSYSGIWK